MKHTEHRTVAYWIASWYLLMLASLLMLAATLITAGEPKSVTLRSSAEWTAERVAMVHAHMGKRETTGNNDGVHIVQYNRTAGGRNNDPYCYSFIYTTGKVAADKTHTVNPLPRTPSTQTAYTEAIRRSVGRTATIRIGDVLIWRVPKKWQGHAETVVAILRPNVVRTGAGNSSSGLQGSQREGGGNYYRTRVLNQPLGRMYLRGRISFTDTLRNDHAEIYSRGRHRTALLHERRSVLH